MNTDSSSSLTGMRTITERFSFDPGLGGVIAIISSVPNPSRGFTYSILATPNRTNPQRSILWKISGNEESTIRSQSLRNFSGIFSVDTVILQKILKQFVFTENFH